MFHVGQNIIFSTAAVMMITVASLHAQEEVLSPLALASENTEAVRHTNLGLQDFLLGWPDGAAYHFRAALHEDPDLLLASVALLQLEHSHLTPNERQQRRQDIQSRLEQSPMTPAEGFYLTCFLQSLTFNTRELQTNLTQHITRYRADILAACWLIMLQHTTTPPYDEHGNPSPSQQKALALIRQLDTAYPEHGLICYTRAKIEETAPQISEEALQSAEKCVRLLSGHPMATRLYGHLLYRSGKASQAAELFKQSAHQAHQRLQAWNLPDDALVLESLLYQATALWVAGQDRASLFCRRHLLKNHQFQNHWEAATLPLRVLIGRKEPPTTGELKAAYRVACQAQLSQETLPVRDSLHHLLQIRRMLHQGQRAQALRSLEHWEQQHKSLLEEQGEAQLNRRGQQAIRLSWARVKAEAFPQAADIWNNNFQEWNDPPAGLLPAIIPTRSAPLDPHYAD